jgi:hypothetical protein
VREAKEIRHHWGLPKQHDFDAVAIASQGCPVQFRTAQVVLKKCVADGDYQLAKGVRGEQRPEVGKMGGFRKFDRVLYQGHEYFIKGRMSSGYAILMDIHGKKADLKPIPKFAKMKRLAARKSWMMTTMDIPLSFNLPVQAETRHSSAQRKITRFSGGYFIN